MPSISLALHAMATRFEIVLHGHDPAALRAAGQEALEEVRRLESRLSLYQPGSEIAHVNALAARAPVRVTPEVFGLLQHAQTLHQETGGAFDISIAPLVRCWGFMGGAGSVPRPKDLAEARAQTGMHLVSLDQKDFTVRFARAGVMLDLGAIGKGYAVERAAGLLREAGIASALLHGGTSTVYALGRPPDAECWKVALDHPKGWPCLQPDSLPGSPFSPSQTAENLPAENRSSFLLPPLATIPLKDEALSVSAVRGKFFESGGKTFGHVIDPRTGRPASSALLAAVLLPSATETDAFSTALLTLGPEGHERLAGLRPGMKTFLVTDSEGQMRVDAR